MCCGIVLPWLHKLCCELWKGVLEGVAAVVKAVEDVAPCFVEVRLRWCRLTFTRLQLLVIRRCGSLKSLDPEMSDLFASSLEVLFSSGALTGDVDLRSVWTTYGLKSVRVVLEVSREVSQFGNPKVHLLCRVID